MYSQWSVSNRLSQGLSGSESNINIYATLNMQINLLCWTLEGRAKSIRFWSTPRVNYLGYPPNPGFQRPSTAISRRQYPHGGGYRLDTMDFQDDSQGWRFDMDMVIIYIYSVNWIIGFFIFCLLCYLFFPSFWESAGVNLQDIAWLLMTFTINICTPF